MVILLMGPPGAGKGTQVDRLSQRYCLNRVSTGDILRQEVANRSELGLKVEGYMKRGKLVPDDIIIDMVSRRLVWNSNCRGYLLDGFPRTIKQAQKLDHLLKEMDKKIDLVFNIGVSEPELIRRISGRRVCPRCFRLYHIEFNKPQVDERCDDCRIPLVQRVDDREDVVRNRLALYREETEPLLEYYRHQSKLVEINGNGNAEEVFNQISAYVDKHLSHNSHNKRKS